MGIVDLLENSDIFGIPLLNGKNFAILFTRYLFNVIVTSVIVHFYYKYSQIKDYIFTFFAFNSMIFFMIYMMNSVNLGIGFGFGLFAVFSILRYRTTTIRIKEMTYLFMVITIALLNSVITNKFGYIELLTCNLMIILITIILEKLMRIQTLSTYKIVYEKIENIKPQNRGLLEADLAERTGLKIVNIKIINIDFLRDVVNIRLYYDQEDNAHGLLTEED